MNEGDKHEAVEHEAGAAGREDAAAPAPPTASGGAGDDGRRMDGPGAGPGAAADRLDPVAAASAEGAPEHHLAPEEEAGLVAAVSEALLDLSDARAGEACVEPGPSDRAGEHVAVSPSDEAAADPSGEPPADEEGGDDEGATEATAGAAAATSVPAVGGGVAAGETGFDHAAAEAMIARAARGVPPVAEVRPTRIVVHDTVLEDPYAWLRAANWREVMRDPGVLAAPIRAYLEAENAYADHAMASTRPLQETLLAELRGRIKEDDATVPQPDGEFAYAMRYTAGAEHPRIVRTTRHGHAEKTLLDANHEAVGTAYFRLAAAEHSPNHRWLAWASDTTGGEEYTVRIRDTARERDLPDAVAGASGSIAWASDNEHLFYVRLDENHRPASVWRHRRGTDPSEDEKVYEEADPGFFVAVGRSLCGRFVLIDTHDHQTSEYRLVPADRPTEPPRLVSPRVEGEEYDVAPHGSHLYVLTNAGGAEDFRIARAPLADPGRENWVDVVPHRPGVLIASMLVFDEYLVRLERADGPPRIVVRRLADGDEHAIAFEEEAYALGMQEGYEFDTRTLRFTYSSMTTPTRVYDYDMETRERVLRKEQEIPSGHDPSRYVTRRIMAPAPDGETVPVSVLHRVDTPVDGTAPCLLYGYGAYGITIPAGFNANALSLVDRGMVFAIAHVRGGKDKGFRWYREGRREKKENTFTDFLAAADHLVAEGFARAGGIVAQGGSAGGMLMGVVANTGGERFAGIVAEVPFVDVLNTMMDATLPLTPPEWPEWGNPIEDEDAFHRIRGYSPYDNVAGRPYPPMLVLAGVSDPRVTYWEPAKWVARLRALRTNDAPLILRTNMEAGHGGASGRFERLHEVAFIQAFTLTTVGRGR